MPLFTPEQKAAALQKNGYDPSTFDVDDNGDVFEKSPTTLQPTVSSVPVTLKNIAATPPSAASVFGRTAAREALPTVAGGLGMAGGAEAGAFIGAFGGPAAPVTIPVGAIIGGIAGAMGGSALQRGVQNKIAEGSGTVFDPAVAAQEAEAHPYASMGGALATLPLGGFNPSPSNVGRAGRTLVSKLLAPGEGVVAPIAGEINPLMRAAENQNLMNVASGAVLNPVIRAGSEIADSYREDRPINLSAKDLLIDAATGAVFNKPNAIGRGLGFHNAEAPTGLTINKGDLTQLTELVAQAEKQAKERQYKETPGVKVKQEGEVPVKVFDPDAKAATVLYGDSGEILNPKKIKILYKDKKTGIYTYADESGIIKEATSEKIPAGQRISKERLGAEPELTEIAKDVAAGKNPSEQENRFTLHNVEVKPELLNMITERGATKPAAVQKILHGLDLNETEAAHLLNLANKQAELKAGDINHPNMKEQGESNLHQKYSDRIEEIYTEDDGEGVTYWANLKDGWMSPDDTVTVHEKSLKALEDKIRTSKQRNQEASGITTEVETKIKDELTKMGVSGGITPQVFSKMQSLGLLRGVTLKPNGELSSAGRTLLHNTFKNASERIAEINPNKSGADTPTHELFHNFFNDLKNSSSATDRDIYRRALELVTGSPEYKMDVAEHQKAGKTPRDAEEFLTQEQGVSILGRMLGIGQESTTGRQWWKDLKLAAKRKWNPDNMTMSEMRDYLTRKWLSDKPYEEQYKKELGAGRNVAPKITSEEKKEGDTHGETDEDAQSSKLDNAPRRGGEGKPASKVFEQGESNLRSKEELKDYGRKLMNEDLGKLYEQTNKLEEKTGEVFINLGLDKKIEELANKPEFFEQNNKGEWTKSDEIYHALHNLFKPYDVENAELNAAMETPGLKTIGVSESAQRTWGPLKSKYPIETSEIEKLYQQYKNSAAYKNLDVVNNKISELLDLYDDITKHVSGSFYGQQGRKGRPLPEHVLKRNTDIKEQPESNFSKKIYEPEDLKKYDELVVNSKKGTLTQRFESMAALEQLRNKYDGMGPYRQDEFSPEQVRADKEEEIKQLYSREQPASTLAEHIKKLKDESNGDDEINVMYSNLVKLIAENSEKYSSIKNATELADYIFNGLEQDDAREWFRNEIGDLPANDYLEDYDKLVKRIKAGQQLATIDWDLRPTKNNTRNQPSSNLTPEEEEAMKRFWFTKRNSGRNKDNTNARGKGEDYNSIRRQQERKEALGEDYTKRDTVRHTPVQEREGKGVVYELNRPNPKYKSEAETPNETPNERTPIGVELDKIVNRLWNRYYDKSELKNLDKEEVKSHVIQSIHNTGLDISQYSNNKLPQVGRTMWRRAESYIKSNILKMQRAGKGIKEESFDAARGEAERSGDEVLQSVADTSNALNMTGYELAERLEKMGVPHKIIAEAEALGSEEVDALEWMSEHGLGPESGNQKQQPSSNLKDNDSGFTTKTEKMISEPKNLYRMPFNHMDRANGEQLLNAIKNKVTPMEWETLEAVGINEKWKNRDVNKDEFLKWIQENGPRVEVRKFGKLTKASGDYALLHQLETAGYVMDIDTVNDRVVFKKRDATGPNRWISLEQLPDELKEAGRAYERLEMGKAEGSDGAAHWQSIAPKSEQDMPGYVEIAVVKRVNPSKPFKGSTPADVSASWDETKFPSSHNFPPNTLGFIRGYMEVNPGYGEWVKRKQQFTNSLSGNIKNQASKVAEWTKENPMPEQKKVFHVIEVQSDWAKIHEIDDPNGSYVPGVRSTGGKWYKTFDGKLFDTRAEAQKHIQSQEALLAHYNRLALKAAIEHARKEGATHIAISDAETAMLTEGHELNVATEVTTPLMKTRGEVERHVAQLKISHPDTNYEIKEYPDGWRARVAIEPKITQEPGMRLNYDSIIPKIAEELTGSKGERMEMGEHKMAYGKLDSETGNSIGNAYRLTDIRGNSSVFPSREMAEANRRNAGDVITPVKIGVRDNLIFRNPDGTPKTSVSGMMYPLEAVNKKLNEGDNFTLFNKHQGVSNLADFSKPDIQRISELNHPEAKKIADAFTDFYEKKDYYTGQFSNDFVDEIKKHIDWKSPKQLFTLDNEKFQNVVKRRWDMMDNGKSNIKLTPEEQQIDDALTRNLQLTLAAKNAIPTFKHQVPTPDYIPMIPSRKTIKTLLNEPGPAKDQLIADWHDYYTKTLGKTRKESEDSLETYMKAFDKKFSNLAQQFGPIDKASGLGIPRSWRETQLADIMTRFNNRYARRIAYLEAIEGKTDVQAALKNPTGIQRSEVANRVMEDISGASDINESKRMAVSRLVRSGMFGPLTGAKDFTSNFTLGWQHMEPKQTIASVVDAISNIKDNWKASFDQGINRNNVSSLEWGEGGLDEVVNGMRRVSDIISTLQGRNTLEKFTRAMAMGQGRYIIKDNLNNFLAGKLGAQGKRALEQFMPDYKTKKSFTQEDIDTAAAKYVNSVQGTYDARGVPDVALHGSWAPILSLARWNIEKMNNFNKHVIAPMKQGDFRPFLMQTLGLVVGGAAVEKVVEAMTDRKSKLPRTSEIQALFNEGRNADGFNALAYKMMGMASMSGYAGVLTDLARVPLDHKFGNRSQGYENPTVWAATSLLKHYGDLQEAYQAGDLGVKTLPDIVGRIMSDYVQSYRLALNHLSSDQQKKIADSDKFRDLKIWKATHGQPVNTFSGDLPNPYLDSDIKDFKKTDDVKEAAKMLPGLIEDALEKANGDPEQLRKLLTKLKTNSYQTIPNPQEAPHSFYSYITWLERTEGKEEAMKRLKDYFLRNAINKAKSGMVPSMPAR